MLQSISPASDRSEAENQGQSRLSGHGRVTEALRRRIEHGDWAPGAAIPSRRHLAAEYKVSPATIERAMVPLLTDGTLRADDRRGTFVAETVASSADPVAAAQSAGTGAFGPHEPAQAAAAVAPGYHHGPVAIVASLYAPDSRDVGQNDHWIREIVGAMENELAEHGRHTVFINRVPHHAPAAVPLRASLEEAIADRTLSGLAFISFDLEPWQIEEAYDVLGRCRFPVVSVVSEPLSLPVPHVLFDNHRAGFQAAHYLLERGHKSLTVLLPERAGWAEARLEGVRAAASRARLPQSDVTVLRGEDRAWDFNGQPMETAATAIKAMFDNGWKPSGPVVCATDMVALVLMEMLTERGYAVGSEIPVLGFDDHEFSRGAGLTTMRPPTRAMGSEAARLLLAGPESRSNGCQLRLCSTLIPRQSTAASSRAPSPSPVRQTVFRAIPEALAV